MSILSITSLKLLTTVYNCMVSHIKILFTNSCGGFVFIIPCHNEIAGSKRVFFLRVGERVSFAPCIHVSLEAKFTQIMSEEFLLSTMMCKILTSIINKRLQQWCDNNNIISGFRQGYSTTDHIFTFSQPWSPSIKGKSYCLFIDFTKAFDRLIIKF